MNKSKQIKFVQRAYRQRIKALQKDFFTNNHTSLQLFVEYLKYIRDCTILRVDNDNEQQVNSSKLPLATLIMAITEFSAYNEENTEIKNLHWENFCELLKENFKDWLTLYDSI